MQSFLETKDTILNKIIDFFSLFYYKPKYFFINIKFKLKNFWQRGKYGFAESDSWEIDNWFSTVFPKIIRNLKNNCHGYPGKFIYDKCFVDFYRTHAMNVQYMENPNIPLCIVNTFHYSNLYGYNISVKLARWILTHYHVGMNLLRVQEEHFGQVLYDQKDIVLFVKNLRSQLNV